MLEIFMHVINLFKYAINLYLLNVISGSIYPFYGPIGKKATTSLGSHSRIELLRAGLVVAPAAGEIESSMDSI